VLVLGVAGFNFCAEFPEEGGEFAGNGYFDFVVMELAFLGILNCGL